MPEMELNQMEAFNSLINSINKNKEINAIARLEKSHCYTCGGHGFKDKICPECGLDIRKIKINSVTQNVAVISKTLDIPLDYRGLTWSYEQLMDMCQMHCKNPVFQKWAKQLEKIHTFFAKGVIPTKSAIIIAPPATGKVTWAYSCMQLAAANGLCVAPLLDTQEVKRLIVLAAERPNQRVCNTTYEEYINSDVMFITVTKTPYREEAYSVIEEVLDKRSRRGLPTYFISRYNMKTMSKRDWEGNFTYVQDSNPNRNMIKYPVILQYSYINPNSTKGV